MHREIDQRFSAWRNGALGPLRKPRSSLTTASFLWWSSSVWTQSPSPISPSFSAPSNMISSLCVDSTLRELGAVFFFFWIFWIGSKFLDDFALDIWYKWYGGVYCLSVMAWYQRARRMNELHSVSLYYLHPVIDLIRIILFTTLRWSAALHHYILWWWSPCISIIHRLRLPFGNPFPSWSWGSRFSHEFQNCRW